MGKEYPDKFIVINAGDGALGCNGALVEYLPILKPNMIVKYNGRLSNRENILVRIVNANTSLAKNGELWNISKDATILELQEGGFYLEQIKGVQLLETETLKKGTGIYIIISIIIAMIVSSFLVQLLRYYFTLDALSIALVLIVAFVIIVIGFFIDERLAKPYEVYTIEILNISDVSSAELFLNYEIVQSVVANRIIKIKRR